MLRTRQPGLCGPGGCRGVGSLGDAAERMWGSPVPSFSPLSLASAPGYPLMGDRRFLVQEFRGAQERLLQGAQGRYPRHQSCEGFWEERGVPGIPPEWGRRGIPPARNWRCPDIPAALSWGGGVSDKEPGDPSRKRLGCMGVPLARNRGVPPPGTGREALRHLPCQKPGCRGCRMPGVPRPPRRCHPGTPLSLCPTLTVGRAVPCRGAAAGRTRGTPQRG